MLWESKLPGTEGPSGFEIHRSKGRLVFENGDIKILQGVQDLFELTDAPEGVSDEAPREGKVILIGKHVGSVDFEASFRNAVV